MKSPIISFLWLAVLAGVSLVTPALAVVNIEWVSVGNAGNAADTQIMNGLFGDYTTGYGSVGYAYNIGKYEVTNAQYVDFLNAKGGSNSAGIYNANMGSYGITQSGSSGNYTYSVTSGYANLPVVYTTWFDAARFSNWLGNGQGSGSMETGAYTLISGQTTGIVTVNPGAQVYIPSEDEWYKAAYYNGTTSTYSLYPNGQNTITMADANYYGSEMKDAGYGTPSAYGTYGQGGNAWEWNDAVINGSQRGLRGGSWDYDVYAPYGYDLASSSRFYALPSGESGDAGFRVASVPEPTSGILAIFAGGMMLTRRKR